MRLPITGDKKKTEFVKKINEINHSLMQNYEDSIKNIIRTSNIKVMLADLSVIETTTFDKQDIIDYFKEKVETLQLLTKTWNVVPVQVTKTDDLYRIYFQLSIEIEKFYFYIYFGLQFHALLYYKVDKKIIELSKRIRELEEKNYQMRGEIALKGDQIIKQELENLGYKEVEDTKLFEELFTKTDISTHLLNKASSIENKFPEIEMNENTLTKLKSDLENMIIEVYKANLVQLDNNSMLQGEEGIIFYIDLEYFKNKKTGEKTSVIKFEKINDSTLKLVEKEFGHIMKIFNKS